MVNSGISHFPQSFLIPKDQLFLFLSVSQSDMHFTLQNPINLSPLPPRNILVKPHHNQNHTFPLHSPSTTHLAGDFHRSVPGKLPSLAKMTGDGVNTTAPTSNVVSRALQDHQTTEMAADPRLARIASSIRVIPDFPKPGIMFQDITTMLLDPVAFKETIDLFVERYEDRNISVVAGIEARGFIFGAPLALALGAKFVPMRKPKKLPGEVISEEYSLEYGTDIMEMHVGAVEAGENALIIDDLIATGGTLAAAIRLLERVGADIVECACLMELSELKGRERLGDKPLFVLISSA